MLSDQTFLILDLWARVGHRFGASPLGFDITSRRFYVSTSPSLLRDFKLTYQALLIWLLLSSTTLIKFLVNREMDKYNITLFFWLSTLTVTVAFSSLRWAPHEISHAANMTIKFLCDVHGNSILNISIDLNNQKALLIVLNFVLQ